MCFDVEAQDTSYTFCCQNVAANSVVAMPAVAAESTACAVALHLLLYLLMLLLHVLMLLLHHLLLYMCAAVLAFAAAACIDAFQCTVALVGVLLHMNLLLLLCTLLQSCLQLPIGSCCHNCCCLLRCHCCMCCCSAVWVIAGACAVTFAYAATLVDVLAAYAVAHAIVVAGAVNITFAAVLCSCYC